MQWRRIFRRLVLGIVVLIFLIYISLLGWHMWQGRRAEQAWGAIQHLQLGTTLTSKSLPSPWKCVDAGAGTECTFTIETWPLPKTDFWFETAGPVLERLGYHGWLVDGGVSIDKAGAVRKRNLLVVTEAVMEPHSEATLSFWDGIDTSSNCDFSVLRHPRYRIHDLQKKGPSLLIRLEADTAGEYRKHGSNIRLACLKKVGKCDFSDLAPFVWADLMADQRWASENQGTVSEFFRTCKDSPVVDSHLN
jgi:hypothetical protein